MASLSRQAASWLDCSGRFERRGTGRDIRRRQPDTATLLSDGSVLNTGGVNDTGVSAAAELWRP